MPVEALSAIRAASQSGLFSCEGGKDRAAYLDRFTRTNRPLWRVLTPAEWDQIWHHVTTYDFPETADNRCELGREAGFGEARQIFVDPTDFFRLFRFEG